MRTFVEFCQRIGVRLTPAQRVLARVAFDGVEPGALVGADRSLARQLFGDIEVVPPAARAVLVLVAGGRGGKTFLNSLRVLHLGLTCSLAGLAAGETAFGIFVAPDLRLARQALRFALGAVQKSAELAPLLGSVTADSFTIRRPDGRTIAFECLPATRGGSAIRGRTLCGALLDECAFFRSADDSAVINDAEIFSACAPRILSGGQLLASSTPWIEQGILFDYFRGQFGKPRTALVGWAPTILLRPTQKARVEAEYARDFSNAEREFGGLFGSVSAGTWFDAQSIDDARGTFSEPLPPSPGQPCTAAIDLAFTADSSALAIVRDEGGKLVLVDWLERRPKRGSPLRPSEIIREFALRARAHGLSELWGDAHNQETVREHLSDMNMGFRLTPGGSTGKEISYRRAQRALVERRVSLPDFPRLLQQFRDVTGKQVPGGGVTISHPRRAGQGHGDLCAAAVVAIANSQRSTRSEDIDCSRFARNEAFDRFGAAPTVTARHTSGLDRIGLGPDGTLRIGAPVPRSRSPHSGGGF